MPKKSSKNARQQETKHNASQVSCSIEASEPTGIPAMARSKASNTAQASHDATSANEGSCQSAGTQQAVNPAVLNGMQRLSLSQMQPDDRFLIRTSDIFPDIRHLLTTFEQLEKCENAVRATYKKGVEFAKVEYRKQYLALMQIDRAGLKSRNDSGDRNAAKQWDRLCEDTTKLFLLRQVLYKKDMHLEHIDGSVSQRRFTQSMHCALSKKSIESVQLTDKEVRELGQLMYTTIDDFAGKQEGAVEVTLSSNISGTHLVILDMSNWVRKGAEIFVFNDTMQKAMALLRKQCGGDIHHAETKYHMFLDEIKDVDFEQLADQVEACITEHAISKFKLFCQQCILVVVTWQIIYNKPIPIKNSDEGVKSRPMLDRLLQQYDAAVSRKILLDVMKGK